MLKNLPADYMKRLIDREPRVQTALEAQQILDRLTAFSLENLTDKNEIVTLPIPDDFGSVKEELALACADFETKWDALKTFVQIEITDIPSHFQCPRGWSVWSGGGWTKVAGFPAGQLTVLDFETVEVDPLNRPGIWHPICAVAMTATQWHVWRCDFDTIDTESVIKFPGSCDILGYNVGYDRSYLDIEYRLEPSGNNFHDLMSMWIVTNGMSNQQKLVFNKFAKSEDDDDDSFDLSSPSWVKRTGTNGLASAYKFYTGKELDKGVRDGIVDGGLSWVTDNMAEVIRYCALDVLATFELASYLVPAYQLQRPSKVNRYGSVLLGSCYVPLDGERYYQYYDKVENVYKGSKKQQNDDLLKAADIYLADGERPDSLDWTEAKTGKNKGQPKWYRDLLPKAKKGDLSLTQRFAPIVLGMQWRGSAIQWDVEQQGWKTQEHGLLPHPTKRGKPVKSMFLKDHAELHENGTISSPEYVSDLVKSRVSAINWVSFRQRAASMRTESPDGFPVYIPMLAVNGTITGRAKDPIVHVASNPKKSRIGTEFKSLIAPPQGYAFVGADVDSQESWLASLHGDEQMGYNGSTPFGAINAMGSSKDKTDIHSTVSRETGYSRDVCKTRVYGCVYGQGIKGDSDVILKADPSLTETQAKMDSTKFIKLFKGSKDYETNSYKGGIASHSFTKMEQIADKHQPRTPLTGAMMSKALAGTKDYKPTRVNWVVQSSGVDFRDMLVILTKWFYKRFGVDGRLVITIHDEIRTCVRTEHVTRAIYALQLAHLYVRAGFILAHKLDNIPAGVAWFSAVDVDSTCLRKDPKDPQVTPTQDALPLGYTVNASQLYIELAQNEV